MIDNSQEYILCAAIWYKELHMERPDFARLSRPRNIFDGVVFAGWRHPFIIHLVAALTGIRSADAGEYVQGFLTSKNRFLTREEAAAFGLKTGQVKELQWMPDEGQLFSEDLY